MSFTPKPWYRIQFLDREGDRCFCHDEKKLKDLRHVRMIVGDDPRDVNVIGNIHLSAPGKNLYLSRRNGIWLDRQGREIPELNEGAT